MMEEMVRSEHAELARSEVERDRDGGTEREHETAGEHEREDMKRA
jgi:hypothetical protein